MSHPSQGEKVQISTWTGSMSFRHSNSLAGLAPCPSFCPGIGCTRPEKRSSKVVRHISRSPLCRSFSRTSFRLVSRMLWHVANKLEDSKSILLLKTWPRKHLLGAAAAQPRSVPPAKGSENMNTCGKQAVSSPVRRSLTTAYCKGSRRTACKQVKGCLHSPRTCDSHSKTVLVPAAR